MSGHTQGNCPKSGGHNIGNDGLFWQDERQRTRPEAVHESRGAFVNLTHIRRDGGSVHNMNNERIKRRTIFHRKDMSDGLFIQGICPKAIDGLSWEGNDISGFEPCACPAD